MIGFSKSVRELVLARANGQCERCGVDADNLQLHHRRPRGMGGSRRKDTNLASNSLALCPPCHCAIESDRELSLWAGWLVRQGRDPAVMPVFRQGRWVLLDDHGCIIPTKGTA